MSFIEEIRKITKVNEEKLRTRGTKKIIKGVKKKIRKRAMKGEYDAEYCIPRGTRFYGNKIEEYFTKEGFAYFITIDFGSGPLIRIFWKEGNNDNY